MRIRAEEFAVENPKKAMGDFRLLLGKLVRVPKSEIQGKRKVTTRRKRKRR